MPSVDTGSKAAAAANETALKTAVDAAITAASTTDVAMAQLGNMTVQTVEGLRAQSRVTLDEAQQLLSGLPGGLDISFTIS